jgi:hypothetical protein
MPVRCGKPCIGLVSFSEVGVDPTDQVTSRDVPDEQVQGVCDLVEPAIARAMGGQGTARQVLGFRTGARALVIPAVVEMPVALKLGAGWGSCEVPGDVVPGGPAVSRHIIVGNPVRNALKAQGCGQPIKQCCCVMLADRLDDTMLLELGLEVFDERWRSGEPADSADHAGRVIQSGGSVRHQSAPQAFS